MIFRKVLIMELILNNDQTKQLETELAQQVLVLVKDGIQKATKNTRPYLNRKEIAEYLARVKEISIDEVANQTETNIHDLFNI